MRLEYVRRTWFVHIPFSATSSDDQFQRDYAETSGSVGCRSIVLEEGERIGGDMSVLGLDTGEVQHSERRWRPDSAATSMMNDLNGHSARYVALLAYFLPRTRS